MKSVAEFYALERWGNLEGIIDPRFYGATGHRGHDIYCGPHEAIPALRAGRIAVAQYSAFIGNVVVLEVAPGDFDGYCHLVNTFDKDDIGKWVKQGAKVGEAATYGDKTGSTWGGPHLHLTNGPLKTSVFNDPRRNPAPIIRAVLAALKNTAPAVDDIKEIIMALTAADAAKVWDSPLESASTDGTNEAGTFLVAGTKAAQEAAKSAKAGATSAAKGVDLLSALTAAYPSAHPDPEAEAAYKAAGKKFTASLISRVAAIHIDTWLLPKIWAAVQDILAKVSAISTPTFTITDEQLGRVLEAKADFIAERVAKRFYNGPVAPTAPA